MNPQISIIIPCYGVEAFLPDIVSDFRSQSFQDIELILVNDGGSEKQLEIMRRLQADNEKISIVDKPNGGLPSARNAGLAQVKGEYIVFLDADDRVAPFFLQRLLEAITAENADIAVGGFTIHYSRENRMVNDFLNTADLPSDENKRIEYLLSVPTVRNSVCNKMYRTQFLKECRISFNEALNYSEDEDFNMRLLLHTSRVALIRESGYIYMCRDSDSICSKYTKHYKEARVTGIQLRKQVMKKIGMSDENIHRILLEDYYLLGYFAVCNLFKKRTPLRTKEKMKYVSMHIFNDPDIVESFVKRDTRNDNLFTKIYNQCFKYRSPFVMVGVFGLLYGLKYRFMRGYVALAPRLKNYKKEGK